MILIPLSIEKSVFIRKLNYLLEKKTALLDHILQSIILWIGCIVALSCTTVDTWSHEVVSGPFFSRPSKEQLCACGVFGKKVSVVKGNCLSGGNRECHSLSNGEL
jgi:hypothetical protein